jgi:quercetin dioxygenase-like cupin family protein
MNRFVEVLVLLALAGVIDIASAQEGVKIFVPDTVEYKPYPLPGVSFAVMSGNPEQQGTYTVWAKLIPGTKIPAHFHPDTRTVTVIAGSYYFAEGDSFDEGKLQGYGPGTVIVVPAGKPHFVSARDEEAIIQESGLGPTAVTPTRR